MKELVGLTVVELFPSQSDTVISQYGTGCFKKLCKISQTVQDNISIMDKIICRISYFCLQKTDDKCQ